MTEEKSFMCEHNAMRRKCVHCELEEAYSEIESLKAITEIAVKGLQILKAMSSKDDIAPALYNSASWYLQEINMLQK